MNTPLFKVDKIVRYSEMRKELEDYTIVMYSKDAIACTREELQELQQLITLALNDRKEESNEK